MESIFAATCEMPHFEPLREDTTADVLVIGGGITGILTAALLKRAGADVLLVEAERLCSGQTGNTTAKITVEHGFIYADLLKRYGKEKAKGFWEANMAALEKYRFLAGKIDCDFKTCDFYAYAEKDHKALGEEVAALSRIGVPSRFVKTPELPFPTVGAICVHGQAQFHPLRFLAALARDLRIHENTPIRALFEGGAQTTDGQTIRASNIVVATHFPFLRFRGGYPLKMYQSRSYVLALEGARLPEHMYADGCGKGVSLRSCGEYLLLGGAGHRTGVEGGGFDRLTELAGMYYPDSRVAYRFAAQDCMTLDGMPYIGRYTKRTQSLFVATGFGKWGMTSAMVSAMLLRDLILERPNPYAELFAPARPLAPGPFVCNVGSVLMHYVRPTAPRCPHLGCALRWNEQERSWDCPCHGSRFSETGELLDDPATKDLQSAKVRKKQ
ncbi:MAG: FAD-dependent oxidoreductase [Clostridia bacterium]|nr:FAD-dependent oxidoreductase [Clostridia bacterium]